VGSFFRGNRKYFAKRPILGGFRWFFWIFMGVCGVIAQKRGGIFGKYECRSFLILRRLSGKIRMYPYK
jgi:hypothetical protein